MSQGICTREISQPLESGKDKETKSPRASRRKAIPLPPENMALKFRPEWHEGDETKALQVKGMEWKTYGNTDDESVTPGTEEGQCSNHGPVESASPGKWLECKCPDPIPNLLNQNP